MKDVRDQPKGLNVDRCICAPGGYEGYTDRCRSVDVEWLETVPPETRDPEREFFIDDLLVRMHFIIVMVRWTGLAPRHVPRNAQNPEPEPRGLKPKTRNTKSGSRSPKPETRDQRSETRNPKPGTQSPKSETRDPRTGIGKTASTIWSTSRGSKWSAP